VGRARGRVIGGEGKEGLMAKSPRLFSNGPEKKINNSMACGKEQGEKTKPTPLTDRSRFRLARKVLPQEKYKGGKNALHFVGRSRYEKKRFAGPRGDRIEAPQKERTVTRKKGVPTDGKGKRGRPNKESYVVKGVKNSKAEGQISRKPRASSQKGAADRRKEQTSCRGRGTGTGREKLQSENELGKNARRKKKRPARLKPAALEYGRALRERKRLQRQGGQRS